MVTGVDDFTSLTACRRAACNTLAISHRLFARFQGLQLLFYILSSFSVLHFLVPVVNNYVFFLYISLLLFTTARIQTLHILPTGYLGWRLSVDFLLQMRTSLGAKGHGKGGRHCFASLQGMAWLGLSWGWWQSGWYSLFQVDE